MNIVEKLPKELQDKVFYHFAEHPCAALVKEWYRHCYYLWAHYEYKSGYYMTMTEMEHEFREYGFFHGGRIIGATGRKGNHGKILFP